MFAMNVYVDWFVDNLQILKDLRAKTKDTNADFEHVEPSDGLELPRLGTFSKLEFFRRRNKHPFAYLMSIPA